MRDEMYLSDKEFEATENKQFSVSDTDSISTKKEQLHNSLLKLSLQGHAKSETCNQGIREKRTFS